MAFNLLKFIKGAVDTLVPGPQFRDRDNKKEEEKKEHKIEINWVKKSDQPSQTATPTPTNIPIPLPEGGYSDPQKIMDWANKIGSGNSPVIQNLPALFQIEKEYDLPGFANVAAIIAQVESNLGRNMGNSNNPYGMLSSGHGSGLIEFPSILDSTKALAEEWTRQETGPRGEIPLYKIPKGTTLNYPTVREKIISRHNQEGGHFAPGNLFDQRWGELVGNPLQTFNPIDENRRQANQSNSLESILGG